MQQDLLNNVNEYKKNNRKKSVWRKIVQGLACGVVFCTTYALILPAITMKQETFCGYEEHMHTQECYVQDALAAILICPLEETEDEVIPTVSGNESIVLENGAGTASIVITDLGEGGESEQAPHKHTAECYAMPSEYPLTCDLEEGANHTHSELCYGSWHLVCEKEEHSHGLICFSNPEADVENTAVWEQMIATVELTGEWSEDMISIAKKQMGYTESTLNYQVSEDGSLCGYTRYGAWSGAPYGEWNTLFAHFCISYAGVEGMPFAAECQEWKKALENAALYQTVQDNPQAGELLFLDENADGLADRVGIVTEITGKTEEAPAQIKAIQGDVEKQVQYVTYNLNDARILGYGRLPKQPAPVYYYADASVQVDVQLPEDTIVPRNARLKVAPIGQDNASYAEMLQQAKAVVDGKVTGIQFYDISFYDKNDVYIPVEDWAQVTMTFAGDVVDSMEDTVVLHYGENQGTPEILDTVGAQDNIMNVVPKVSYVASLNSENNTKLTFFTKGFSVFAVVDVKMGTYTTRIMDLNNLQQLYNYVSEAGSNGRIVTIGNDFLGTGHNKSVLSNELVVVNEQNTSYDGEGNVTGTYYSQHERLRSADAATSFAWENLGATEVVTSADDDLLWRITAVSGKTNTYYIESIGRPGQYLCIGPDQMLKTTTTPNEIICEVDGVLLTLRSGNNYLAYYEQEQKPNQEGITVFGATDGYIGTAGSGYNPNSFFFAEYNYQTTYTEYITNLDGKIVAIVAVNNDQEPGSSGNPYPAIASQLTGEGGGLIGADVDSFWIDGSGNPAFSDDDNMGWDSSGNRILWEFEATDTPGAYYIKAANFNGTPKNPLAGQYMNIAYNGNGELVLTVSPNKQALEVVRGYGSQNGDVQNVACIRANINGQYAYVQLGNNYGGWNFGRSIMDGNSNTVNNRANHFVLAQLQSSEMTAVNQVIAMIENLPLTEEFEAIAGAPSSTKEFQSDIDYRKAKRQEAIAAKAAYDNLSDLQKNFVNQEYTKKLLEDLEWLWRPEPQVVPAVDLNATVKVFNYDSTINSAEGNELSKENGFIFFTTNASYGKAVDGHVVNPSMPNPHVDSLLVNGYPYLYTYANDGTTQIGEGSMQFLFQEGSPYHKGTMNDGGGLFQQDAEGYYYYYSDHNAAWYNGSEFVLYDVVVRPEYTYSTATNDERSNFLPFNQVVGNIIYDYESEDYDAVKDKHNNTVISSVDGQEHETAYLNSYIDLWFGMSIEYDFFIPRGAKVNEKDMVFEFHGDDDVLVYIDDVLILDISGAHAARSGSINFTTGEVTWQVGLNSSGQPIMHSSTIAQMFRNAGKPITTDASGKTFADYSMHNLDFFYMERGGNISYAGIKFNLPTLPEDSLWVGKERHADTAFIDAQLDYTFKVIKGNNTQESFFVQNHAYMIYENGDYVGTGRVNADGTFTLKAGQWAMFPDVIEAANGQSEFYVQEIIPTSIKEQYVTSYQDDTLTTKWPGQSTSGDNTVYQSQKYSIEEGAYNYTKTVIYTNSINGDVLDTLNITKLAGDSTYIDPNKEFRIQVQVGNNSTDLINLPQGTAYAIKDSAGNTVGNGSVDAEGVITLKVGQTATITGFLAGTYWRIEELLGADESFTPVYEGTALKGSIDVTGNAGTFGVGDTVSFTVTNYAYDFILYLPLSKEAIQNTSNARFNFTVEQGTWSDSNGDGVSEWIKWNDKNGTSILVPDDAVKTGNIVLGFYNWESGSYYYKVAEHKEDGEFIYDETFYIVQVDIVENNGVKSAQIAGIRKNGTDWISTTDPMPFVNYKSELLTVEKEVVNTSDPSNVAGSFTFEVTVKLDGQPFTRIPDAEDGSYVVDHVNGVVSFALKHEQSVTIPVPQGAVVTVAETKDSAYTTSYRITQGAQAPGAYVSGNATGEIAVGTDAVTVHYLNRTGYELPKTGGGILGIYGLGSLLLALAFGGLLIVRMRRKMH